MKELDIRRLIPLAALGSFSFIGCGGRASLDPDPSLSEPGAPGGTPAETPTKPDAPGYTFEAAVETLAEDICRKDRDCDPSDFGRKYASFSDCAEEVVKSVDEAFELTIEQCRDLVINVLSCVNDHHYCDENHDDCNGEVYALVEENCLIADYYEYDYDYDYNPPPPTPQPR